MSFYTCSAGSSQRTGIPQPKIARKIGREWPPPGIPSRVLSPLQCASSLALPTPATSAACYPMDDHDIIDINLRIIINHCGMYAEEYKTGSCVRTQFHKLSRGLTPSRNIGPRRLHLSIRLLSRPCNMITELPPWTMTHMLPRTLTCLQTLVPHLQPRKKP